MSSEATPWMEWNKFCMTFSNSPATDVSSLLKLFFEKAVSDVIPIKLVAADRIDDGAETGLRLRFVVSTPDAWGTYSEHREVVDTYIKGKVGAAFDGLAHTTEPVVRLKSVKAERGSCGLDIAIVAVALKYAPLVAAAAGVANTGIGIWNLFKSLRSPKPP